MQRRTRATMGLPGRRNKKIDTAAGKYAAGKMVNGTAADESVSPNRQGRSPKGTGVVLAPPNEEPDVAAPATKKQRRDKQPEDTVEPSVLKRTPRRSATKPPVIDESTSDEDQDDAMDADFAADYFWGGKGRATNGKKAGKSRRRNQKVDHESGEDENEDSVEGEDEGQDEAGRANAGETEDDEDSGVEKSKGGRPKKATAKGASRAKVKKGAPKKSKERQSAVDNDVVEERATKLRNLFDDLPDKDVVDLQEALYEADWDLSAAKEIMASGALASSDEDANA